MATLVGLVSCLLWGDRVYANPIDYFGFGARGLGLGNAMSALADDFSATYYNPAGLTVKDALQLELGYLFIDPTLELDGADLDVDGVRGFQGGLVVPGEVLGRRLAVALGLHLPDERITRLRALPESQPRFVLYDNHPQRLVLTTSLAYEIVPEVLSLGLGLTYLSDTQGRLTLNGLVDFQDAGGTTLQTAVDVDFKAVRYLSAGVLVRPTRELRIGLAFRDEFDLTLDIGVIVNGDIVLDGASESPVPLVEGARLEVVSQNSNLFSPRQVVLGIAWSAFRDAADPDLARRSPRPCWTVTAELGWYQWSRFESPTAYLSTSLDAGTLPISIPPNPRPLAPEFHDIVVPRLGGEIWVFDSEHVELFARAGAYWEASPAPAQSGLTNFADGDKFGFGLGLSVGLKDLGEALARPLWIDLGASYIAMPERRHEKRDPADPTGDYVSSGHFFGFAASLRLELGEAE